MFEVCGEMTIMAYEYKIISREINDYMVGPSVQKIEDEVNKLATAGWRIVNTYQDAHCMSFVLERDKPALRRTG